VIENILPFLIVKKHNALICLDFLNKKKVEFNMKESRPNTSFGAKNHLKGNWGDSEGHRRSALCARNHHLKGNRGDFEQHSRAGRLKGKNFL
jgi:hypothetical protein